MEKCEYKSVYVGTEKAKRVVYMDRYIIEEGQIWYYQSYGTTFQSLPSTQIYKMTMWYTKSIDTMHGLLTLWNDIAEEPKLKVELIDLV